MAITFDDRGGFISALERDTTRRKPKPDRNAQLGALPALRRTLAAVPGAAGAETPAPVGNGVLRTDVAAPLAADQVPARTAAAPQRELGTVAGMNYEDVVGAGQRKRTFMNPDGSVAGTVEGAANGILKKTPYARDVKTGNALRDRNGGSVPSGQGGVTTGATDLFNPYAGIDAFERIKSAFSARARPESVTGLTGTKIEQVPEDESTLRRQLEAQAVAPSKSIADAFGNAGRRKFARERLASLDAAEKAQAGDDAALRRELLQQEGEDRRAGARNQIDLSRLGLDMRRLGVEAEDKAASRATQGEEAFYKKLDREFELDAAPAGADDEIAADIASRNQGKLARKKEIGAFAQRLGETGGNFRQLVDLYDATEVLAKQAEEDSGPLPELFGNFLWMLDPEKGGVPQDPETALAELEPVLDQYADTKTTKFNYRGVSFDKSDLTREQRRVLGYLARKRKEALSGGAG